MVFNNNFEQKVERVKTDKNDNFIILDINIQGKRIILLNVHGPNQDSPNFYHYIIKKSTVLKMTRLLFVGTGILLLILK